MTDYDDGQPIGQDDNDNDNAEHPSNSAPIEPVQRHQRKCTAHKTNGQPCERWAIAGGRVCPSHGGRAAQVRRKARQRLEEATDRMAKELLRMAVDPGVSDAVKLRAITEALDRGNLSAKTEIEVSAKPFEQIAESAAMTLEITSRAEFRRAQGTEDGESDDDDPLASLHAADVAKATVDESRRCDEICYGTSDPNVIDAETVEIDGDVIDYGHTITPGDYEREPTRLGVPPLDPLTGRPHFDPAEFDGPMTTEQANDVVAEINRRNAERVQRERADAGRAVVHPVRRALPRGRS
ncbi:hypothetical protein MMAG44476_37763 [Mycolicibacterium mageritense DSM 44476 = CIP 104973]|uniref:DUF222 domain-containing protein n=1 Tax=Mycolicibacterium mageritense TaxID=53462 RepID=A0ABM7HKE0_MYCME|nr:hypothetical protein [Mycolicibacterium mageritense]BBX30952.1 hypothetical protein MMAGJ_02340 [Mycolicibacterium mageritense]CDO24702.1 hypothetical protein BN978_05202 [Mycolicibacterium mageritense DSM 44476 = CIP 104973]